MKKYVLIFTLTIMSSFGFNSYAEEYDYYSENESENETDYNENEDENEDEQAQNVYDMLSSFTGTIYTAPVPQSVLDGDEPPDYEDEDEENDGEDSENGEDEPYVFTNVPPDVTGNAQVVEKQEILFSDGVFEFISVTTKNGNVFYIFIRHDLEEDMANVFFLSKVNERELLTLIYPDQEFGDDFPSPALQIAPPGENQENQEDGFESPPPPPQSDSVVPRSGIIISFITLVIGCGVFAWYKLKPKLKNKSRFDESLDDGDDGGYEADEYISDYEEE